MSTPILLLNAGSSSIKYQVIDADDERVLATGLIERIGQELSRIKHTVGDETFTEEESYPNHTVALAAMVTMFEEHGPALDQVKAVGHRTVHGGDKLTHSTVIDDHVIETLEELSPLAPLHNPPGIAGIRGARRALPNVPHVAVFDTAFFSSLPPEAYTYAVPTGIAEQYSVRRYGFHGTSHNYVSHTVAETLGVDYESLKQIVCHLGNGASISAIDHGVAVDTSMGLTPLQGLVMGTRSGDVDPGLIFYLHREAGFSVDAIDNLLNKKSGMIGLAGASDFRDISAKIEAGDERAKIALDVYIHRLLHYIGAYMAILGGVDTITFTAGVGENDPVIRARVCERLAGLGVKLDPERNAERSSQPRVISTDDSPVTVLVVPTNEELQMAREVSAVIAG
ncbi:acetate/propionate family kinase [Propioniciclava soli]|uniref:acetate/propionate family kinase n=1 Tax=Propioniciclava soli TaxID=2775081 RepID=UPI001E2F8BFE